MIDPPADIRTLGAVTKLDRARAYAGLGVIALGFVFELVRKRR